MYYEIYYFMIIEKKYIYFNEEKLYEIIDRQYLLFDYLLYLFSYKSQVVYLILMFNIFTIS